MATLPPIPPLSFPNVQIAPPKPPAPVVQATAPPPPKKKRREKIRHRVRKPETETAANEPAPEPAAVNGAAVLGNLSADDASSNPKQNAQIEHLIRDTENRLKKMPRAQRARHKDAIVQVESFIGQAKQAWAMNDVVGASTLANKARILLDEILK